MARRPRIFNEGGLYHVYSRVSSGEPIFADLNEAIETPLAREEPFGRDCGARLARY